MQNELEKLCKVWVRPESLRVKFYPRTMKVHGYFKILCISIAILYPQLLEKTVT